MGATEKGGCNCPPMEDVFRHGVGTKPPCPVHDTPEMLAVLAEIIVPRKHFDGPISFAPSSEGQSPSADAPGTGGSPNPERERWTMYLCSVCGHMGSTDTCAGPHAHHDLLRRPPVEVVARKRGMNTVEDVEEALMRCAVAVGYDEGLTAEDFDVVGVVADMVESVAREVREAEAREEELREALRLCVRTQFQGPGGRRAWEHSRDVLARRPSAKGSSPESRPGLDGRE